MNVKSHSPKVKAREGERKRSGRGKMQKNGRTNEERNK